MPRFLCQSELRFTKMKYIITEMKNATTEMENEIFCLFDLFIYLFFMKILDTSFCNVDLILHFYVTNKKINIKNINNKKEGKMQINKSEKKKYHYIWT